MRWVAGDAPRGRRALLRSVEPTAGRYSASIAERSQARRRSPAILNRIPGFERLWARDPCPVGVSEISAADGRSNRCDVAVDQLVLAAHLDASERADRLEDDKGTPGIASKLAQFRVALGDHDLEPTVDPAVPDGRDRRSAVPPIRHQNRRRRSLEERTNAANLIVGHRAEPTIPRCRQLLGNWPTACSRPLRLTSSPHTDFAFTFSLFTFVGEALLILWLIGRAIKGFPSESESTGGQVTDSALAQPAPVAS